MNLQQLEYIVAVDRLKNFSQAAESCHVTQATLSAMIKKLEEEIGLIIFDRKVSPVITTDDGRRVIEQARMALYHTQQLADLSNQLKSTVEGELYIGIIPTVANTLLPLVLKPLLDLYPNLRLHIHELTTENVVARLKNGSLDMGIVATPLKETQIEESILFYEAMFVYGSTGPESSYVVTEDLQDQQVWLLEEGHCFRDQTIDVCKLKKSHALPANLEFEGNSFDTLLNITDAFGGITLIPELYYAQLPELRKQKTKPFKVPIPVREISLVYYRPHARLRVINQLSEDIRGLMKGKLMASNYRNHELSIIGI